MKKNFRDVKEEIRRRIVSGIWKPGDLLPNEVDLAVEFECGRTTVNRAMRELAEEGLVERKRKAGTRVRLLPVRQARFGIPIVGQEIEDRGATYRYSLVKREVIDTPEWLRPRLNLSRGSRVLHLTCVHYSDGSPYQYEDRWINLTALPQAADADFSATGPNEWLVNTVPYSDAEISFSATPADDEMAQYLGCSPGDALFLTERSTWFEDHALTYVRLAFQRGYRMTTRY